MAVVMDLCDQFALNERIAFPIDDDEKLALAIEHEIPYKQNSEIAFGTRYESMHSVREFNRIMLDEDIMKKLKTEDPDNGSEPNYH